MLARFWQRLLLFEGLLYAVLLVLEILKWYEAVIILLAWRVIFVLTPMIRSAWAEERVPLTSWEYVRMAWGELSIRFKIHFFTAPAVAWLPNGDLQANPQQIPVIFLHGLLSNRGVWQRAQAKLTQHGYHNHHSFTYEPLLSPIEDYLLPLQEQVGQVQQQTRQKQVILVGHSMGGLLARLYAQQHPEQIKHIITLASPHHGTHLACRSSVGQNVAQMCVGSTWLLQLDRAERQQGHVPITSIFSLHDNLNVPAMTSVLAHGDNISLCGIGHQHMVTHPRCLSLLWQAIEAINAKHYAKR